MAEAYSSLDASQNQIRLLHLAPADDNSDPIQCHFTITSLDHAPRYDALSYVWGDYAGSHSVQHGDRAVFVTDNLFSALRRLRSRETSLALWVDALCINQLDLDEKSQQVSRMAEIYQQAAQVVVWLGEGWDGSDQAMHFLRVIAEDPLIHLDPSLNPYVAINDGQTLESAELRSHICRLFTLPWWNRTWTIQEFVLARNLVFQCAESRVSRHIMYMARENFWAHKDRCCPARLLEAHDQETRMSLSSAFEVPARLDFISKQRGNCYSILTPVVSFCKRGVTDPRDRVYSLLGLGTGPYAALVNPDYTLTPEQVCEETALRSLERTGKLEFLSHLFPHKNPNLPSWVPNWTGEFEWFDIYGLWLGHTSSFRASGDTKAQYRLIKRGMLAVQGVVVDRITAVCSACVIKRLREPNYIIELLQLACPDTSYNAPYTATGEPRLLAFWHTLNGGVQMILQDSNRYYSRLRGSADLSRCVKFVRFMDPSVNNRAGLWDLEMEHILLDVETGTRGRKVFATQNGLLGVGSSKCEEGDQVAVLLGGNMPYIVRPKAESDGMFRILGDAYVHGIMDGEALQGEANNIRELKEMVLI